MGTKIQVTFHPRRRVSRDRIVLPEGLLEGVERNTLSSTGTPICCARRGFICGADCSVHGPPGTGRVDHAVEFPLPDAVSRERLLRLCCEGLSVDAAVLPALVGQTEGASPAFLRELVRKASLVAAVDQASTLDDGHFAAALRELEAGGRLTRSILGGGGDPAPAPAAAATGYPRPEAPRQRGADPRASRRARIAIGRAGRRAHSTPRRPRHRASPPAKVVKPTAASCLRASRF